MNWITTVLLAALLGLAITPRAGAEPAAPTPKPRHKKPPAALNHAVVLFDMENGRLSSWTGDEVPPALVARDSHNPGENLADYLGAHYTIVAVARTGEGRMAVASLVKTAKKEVTFVEFNPGDGDIHATIGDGDWRFLGEFLTNGYVVRVLIDTGDPHLMGAVLEK